MKHIFLLKHLLIAALVTMSVNGYSQLSPLSIGTIPAGDSVVIYYDVTINAGLAPTVMYIANQGTVSGSNFANVVTDDPKTVAALDSTKTLLNAFPLPVTVSELKAQQKNGGIELSWKVSAELNLQDYGVEKSSDGISFVQIGNTNATGRTTYSYPDLQPLSGNNFYRLKLNDRDGRFRYSNVVKINISNKGESISIYPNPVYNKTFNLQLNNMAKGKYEMTIYSNSGQLVYKSAIEHAGGSAGQTITLPVNLVKGVYGVKLKSGGVIFNQQLIVN